MIECDLRLDDVAGLCHLQVDQRTLDTAGTTTNRDRRCNRGDGGDSFRVQVLPGLAGQRRDVRAFLIPYVGQAAAQHHRCGLESIVVAKQGDGRLARPRKGGNDAFAGP